MRMRSGIGLVAAIGLLAGIAAARADEQEIPVKDVPRPVINAINARFPGAKLGDALKYDEEGKTFYDVELAYKNHDYTVTSKPDGAIVEIDKDIEIKDLPPALSAALKAKYPRGKLLEATEVTEGTVLKYAVVVQLASKKRLEVTLDRSGKILDTEPVEDEK